jgi:hypothetical protein
MSEGTPILDTISALRSERDALQDLINMFATVDWKAKHAGAYVGEIPLDLLNRTRMAYNTQRRCHF